MKIRSIAFTALAASILSAVAQKDALERSPELQVLDRFVGIWDTEVTTKPVGGEKTSGKVVSRRSWTLGGTFLRFEDPNLENPEQPEFHMLFTYDPSAKNYTGVSMHGVGRNNFTAVWDARTTTMTFTFELPDGGKIVSAHRFIGEDRAISKGVFTNAEGEMYLEATWAQTRRKAESEKPK